VRAPDRTLPPLPTLAALVVGAAVAGAALATPAIALGLPPVPAVPAPAPTAPAQGLVTLLTGGVAGPGVTSPSSQPSLSPPIPIPIPSASASAPATPLAPASGLPVVGSVVEPVLGAVGAGSPTGGPPAAPTTLPGRPVLPSVPAAPTAPRTSLAGGAPSVAGAGPRLTVPALPRAGVPRRPAGAVVLGLRVARPRSVPDVPAGLTLGRTEEHALAGAVGGPAAVGTLLPAAAALPVLFTAAAPLVSPADLPAPVLLPVARPGSAPSAALSPPAATHVSAATPAGLPATIVVTAIGMVVAAAGAQVVVVRRRRAT